MSSFCLSRPPGRPFIVDLRHCELGDDWPPGDGWALIQADECRVRSQYLRLSGDLLQRNLEAAGMGHVKITKTTDWVLYNDL
jgi:hypothetical protein